MIPSDIFLAVCAILILRIITFISAADLPLSVLDRIDQVSVVDMKIRDHEVLPFTGSPADILCMPHLVVLHVIRSDQSRRMIICHRLALKRRHGRLGKHFIRRTDDSDDLAGIPTGEPQLTSEIVLRSSAGNRHILTNQKALASLNLVWAYRVSVICKHLFPPFCLVAPRAAFHIATIRAGIPAPVFAVVMATPMLSDPLENSHCDHLPVCCDVATPKNGYKNTTGHF